MRQRLAMILAALTGVGLITGVAWAAMPQAALTVVDERTVSAADAGEVTFRVEESGLAVVEIQTSAGWVSETEVASGPQIEVDFRRGDRRVRFDAELEAGEVRVDVRQEGGTETTVETSQVTAASDGATTTTVDGSTSTTVNGTSSTTQGTAPGSSSTTVGDTTSTSSSVSPTTEATTPSTTVPDSASTTGAMTSTTIDDTTSTSHGEPELAAGSETYQIPGVATVAIAWADGRLTLVSYSAANGWVAEIEDQRADRIRIDFESEDDDARFEARLDGQDLRVEARRD